MWIVVICRYVKGQDFEEIHWLLKQKYSKVGREVGEHVQPRVRKFKGKVVKKWHCVYVLLNK